MLCPRAAVGCNGSSPRPEDTTQLNMLQELWYRTFLYRRMSQSHDERACSIRGSHNYSDDVIVRVVCGSPVYYKHFRTCLRPEGA